MQGAALAAALTQSLGNLKSLPGKEERVEELVFAMAKLDTLLENVLAEAWLRGREVIPPLGVVR